MKKSEQLMKASIEEDNDFKAASLFTKALRESRSEKFEEDYLPILNKRYVIKLRQNTSYSITTQKYGVIDYFPKSNKLLIRRDNKWIKPGLNWILNNIL